MKYLQEIRANLEGDVTPEKVKTALAAFQECLNKYGVTDTYELPWRRQTQKGCFHTGIMYMESEKPLQMKRLVLRRH